MSNDKQKDLDFIHHDLLSVMLKIRAIAGLFDGEENGDRKLDSEASTGLYYLLEDIASEIQDNLNHLDGWKCKKCANKHGEREEVEKRYPELGRILEVANEAAQTGDTANLIMYLDGFTKQLKQDACQPAA